MAGVSLSPGQYRNLHIKQDLLPYEDIFLVELSQDALDEALGGRCALSAALFLHSAKWDDCDKLHA